MSKLRKRLEKTATKNEQLYNKLISALDEYVADAAWSELISANGKVGNYLKEIKKNDPSCGYITNTMHAIGDTSKIDRLLVELISDEKIETINQSEIEMSQS